MRFDNPLRSLQHFGASVFRRHDGAQQPSAGATPGVPLQPLGPPTRLALAVNAQGRVEVSDRATIGGLDNEQRLLSEILNKPGQSFAQHPGGQLIDAHGFAVRADASAHTVHAYVASRPHRAGGTPPPIPFDKGHLAQKSGIFEGAGRDVWTLHDKQLFRFGGDASWPRGQIQIIEP
jgi:hypothetical protein